MLYSVLFDVDIIPQIFFVLDNLDIFEDYRRFVEIAFVVWLMFPYDSGQAFLAGISECDMMLVSFSAHHSRS